MKKTTSILLGLVLVLIGACAPQDDTNAASNMLPAKISVSGKNFSSLKYFVDKNKFGPLIKKNFGNGVTYSASLSVTAGTHSLKIVGDNKNVGNDLIVKINDHRVCQTSNDLLTFAMPITADQACTDLLVEKIKVGMHLASQETALPMFADETTFQSLITYKLPFVYVDVECFAPGNEGCVNKVKSLKAVGTLIMPYVNPQECMLGDSINDRPFQKELCDWVGQNAPEWLMKGTDGQPLILWHVPDMQTLNLSRNCPLHNGQKWSEYFVNFYLQKLIPYADLIDGILFDNAKAYISYEDKLKLYDSNGKVLDFFQTDDSWRGGYRDMLVYFHDQVKKYYPQFTAGGKEFLTAINSKQSDFSDLADVVILESPFNSSVGALSKEYDPFAVADIYIRNAAKSRLMIIEHCVAKNGECQKFFYPADNGRETGYALTLLADNSMFIFDHDGPLSHWGFTFDPIYKISGKAIGAVQYPYVSKFSQAEKQTLTNGKSITIPSVHKGDVIRYTYRINGTYWMNSLHNSDEDAKELAQKTRWVDGTVNGYAKNDGDFVITFTGEGSADVSDIMHLDPTATTTDFMFCREYEFAKACFNPSTTETRHMVFNGITVEVPPMEGKVL